MFSVPSASSILPAESPHGEAHAVFNESVIVWADAPNSTLEGPDVSRYNARGDSETLGGKSAVDPLWERGLVLVRVAVILHERLGNWNRQLRPWLHGLPIRWFETRSQADLDAVLTGLAYPVVLIDLARQAVQGLKDLCQVHERAPDARTFVLDPEVHAGVVELARELGATYAAAGFVPPPVVASLLARWVVLAQQSIEKEGWSQTAFPETKTEAWSWLDEYPADPYSHESRRV
jgi:hypothetical protein